MADNGWIAMADSGGAAAGPQQLTAPAAVLMGHDGRAGNGSLRERGRPALRSQPHGGRRRPDDDAVVPVEDSERCWDTLVVSRSLT